MSVTPEELGPQFYLENAIYRLEATADGRLLDVELTLNETYPQEDKQRIMQQLKVPLGVENDPNRSMAVAPKVRLLAGIVRTIIANFLTCCKAKTYYERPKLSICHHSNTTHRHLM